MENILDAFNVPPTSTAVLQESGSQFRFYQGFMYVMPAKEEYPDFCPLDWQDPEQSIEIFDQKLRIESTPQLKELLRKQRRSRLKLVSRATVQNPKALQGHSLNLKKWMQDEGVPPWRRHSVPLLTVAHRDSDIVLAPIDQHRFSEWVMVDQA